MPLLPVTPSLSNRPSEKEDLEHRVNREIVPVLKAVRDEVNVLAAELNGGTISFGSVDPVLIPPTGEDGDLYIRKDGAVGTQLWIRTAGAWRAIA